MNITPEQIKQTVAEIRERHTKDEAFFSKYSKIYDSLKDDLYKDRSTLLEIVTILQKTMEEQSDVIVENSQTLMNLHSKISEQASVIERLKKRDPE